MPPPARSRDWAGSLPDEILACILPLLPSFADHLHFAAVCSPWRSVAKHFRRRHRSPTASPWILLTSPPLRPADARGSLHFLRPSDGVLLPVPLPYRGQPRCVGISPDGWLILDDGGPRRLHAINPLTGRMLLLPSPAAVSRGTRTVYKVAMSTCPYAGDASLDAVDAGWPGTAVFAAVLSDGPRAFFEKSVALARAGDHQWEVLRMGHLKKVFDVTYHQGKFYILGNMTEVFNCHYDYNILSYIVVVDFGAGDPLSTAKVTFLPFDYGYSALDSTFRLICSPSGDLLAVTLAVTPYEKSPVYVVRVCSRGGQTQSDFGDRALLVGDPFSIAVSTRGIPQLKGNCVYLIRSRGSSIMEVFSFDTERLGTRQLPRRIMGAWFVPGLL